MPGHRRAPIPNEYVEMSIKAGFFKAIETILFLTLARVNLLVQYLPLELHHPQTLLLG
jgi:hypothetical protein